MTYANDEFILDTPTVRDFVNETRRELAGRADPASGLDALRPAFSRLLSDRYWLPEAYAAPNPEGGMGGGIGQWLLFRAADRSLSLFSLVVPAGSATPVHDHLAWGLVGLYRGRQEETLYRRTDAGGEKGRARLEVAESREIGAGDFYRLLPPEGDIHGVKTVSEEASVSIHLLGNDAGCTWRHTFDPDENRVEPFRSGYSNVPCDPAEGAFSADSGVREG